MPIPRVIVSDSPLGFIPLFIANPKFMQEDNTMTCL
jgi:hypothetical protein